MCPGRARSSGPVAGSTSARTVAARSAALMPVETPRRASTLTVKAVWKGLVNVRGRLCPVLDLGRYLQVPEPESPSLPPRDRRMLVVVTALGLTVGLIVDAVGEIRRVPMGSVKASAAESLGGGATAILGVTDDLISVLDVEALLADPSLIVQGR